MKAPSIKARRIATLSVAPVAILTAGLLVWQASYAAFSATTGNTGNKWTTTALSLTDDDSAHASFVVPNAQPGDSGTRCIAVTTSDSPGTVKSYVANLVPSGVTPLGLEDAIKIQIEQGSPGTFADCAGFVATPDSVALQGSLSALAADHADFTTGGTVWNTAGNETKSFRVSWMFDPQGLTPEEINALQGKTTGIDIVWEMQGA